MIDAFDMASWNSGFSITKYFVIIPDQQGYNFIVSITKGTISGVYWALSYVPTILSTLVQ